VLEQGQRIADRYVLISRLGSGGMADVWLADDEMLERRVALKFLHERFAQDTQFVERFRREAQAAAGMQHQNIVGVYDRGEADGRNFIAMEYVEGASLKDLITRGLSIGEALEIIRQVLAGTKFAHENGIIHRDLKPQNVLVDREGRARVADFGIARAGASEITQTGSVLGTAQYLSPEQAQGLAVTAASDLYSVGVMLYECLTGRVPFEADSPVAVALKQISEQPRPPSEINPEVTPALDAVVLRSLAKDPAFRFQTADEFRAAIDAAELDPATPAALGAVAAAAIDEADIDALLAADDARRRRIRNILIGTLLVLLIAGGIVAYALTRTERVNVPHVIGQQVGQARAQLEGDGFNVSISHIKSCDPVGTVTEQQPPAGSEVDEGSRVVLTQSDGSTITIPPLKNKTADDATKQLEDLNLIAGTPEERPSPNVDPGKVIGTSPEEGTSVDCNSTVTLIVSKGANTIDVPNVVGEQRDAAVSQLRDLGLVARTETRNADEPEGQVIGQDPAAGAAGVLRNDTVTLVVSNGVGSVSVPNVVGQTEDAARSRLGAVGLDPDIVEQDTEQQSQDGRVLEQSPAGGTRAHSGDPVTLVVGHFVEPTTSTTTTSTTSTTSTTTTTGP
jgi:eukaryotic-like serine/threonine-protein kinase